MTRFLFVFALLLSACAAPQPAAPVVPNTAPAADWPRQIETMDGTVTLERRPERLHALSLGYEEILLALAGPERFAAVSTFALDPALSNSISAASRVPRAIGRDPEAIVASDPDVIIAATTSRKDLLDRLRAAGVTVLVAPFRETIDDLPRTIRWLARISGDDAAAERMIAAIEQRLARIDAVVATKPEAERPRTLLITGAGYAVAGEGALRSSLLRRAGARNAAAEAGIQGDKQIGLESIVAIDPAVILTADTTRVDLAGQLRENPALVDVAAVKQGRVIPIRDTQLSVLSHYQIRGIEEMARALYPNDFANVTFADFPERF
ncbi:MAG: periplasmic-binding protein [Dehalococcoidia bacterium]|nr:MAG: periplasmic-binding protein [Dehalococcoidia bacterium]